MEAANLDKYQTSLTQRLQNQKLMEICCAYNTEGFTDLDKLNMFKFAYGSMVLVLSKFLLLPQLP